MRLRSQEGTRCAPPGRPRPGARRTSARCCLNGSLAPRCFVPAGEAHAVPRLMAQEAPCGGLLGEGGQGLSLVPTFACSFQV